MSTLVFRGFQETELRIFEAWFADPLLRKYILPPTPAWFDYVQSTPGVYAWMAYNGETPVGYVQVDTAGSTAWLVVAVNPWMRRWGYGAAILNAVCQRPELAGLESITAETDCNNSASQRCLLRAGFVKQGDCFSDDSAIQFIRRLT